jgi:hypothetical protein
VKELLVPGSKYDPRCWTTTGRWTVEPEFAALARAPAFGQRFFRELFGRFPTLSMRVTFLQWSVQPDDVYAVFELRETGFGVQVDPSLEYVIIWEPGGQVEYGDWDGDQVSPAIEHVQNLIAGRSA